MSVIKIFKCDLCGDEKITTGVHGRTPNQFWKVGVTAKPLNESGRDYNNYAITPLEVCRPCLETLGIYVQEKTKELETHKPPTLEELIVDLVRRERETSHE